MRHIIENVLFFSSISLFCFSNQNAKDTEMKRVLPSPQFEDSPSSSVFHPILCLHPARVLVVLFCSSVSSFALIAGKTRRKGILRASTVMDARSCWILLLFRFEHIVAVRMTCLLKDPFILESFCIIAIVSLACTWSELVQISMEPRLDGTLSWSIISRQQEIPCISLWLSIVETRKAEKVCSNTC